MGPKWGDRRSPLRPMKNALLPRLFREPDQTQFLYGLVHGMYLVDRLGRARERVRETMAPLQCLGRTPSRNKIVPNWSVSYCGPLRILQQADVFLNRRRHRRITHRRSPVWFDRGREGVNRDVAPVALGRTINREEAIPIGGYRWTPTVTTNGFHVTERW